MVDNFRIPKTIRITKKRHHESHWSMEIVDFMVNHVYKFWGLRVIGDQFFDRTKMRLLIRTCFVFTAFLYDAPLSSCSRPFIRLVIRTPVTLLQGHPRSKLMAPLERASMNFYLKGSKRMTQDAPFPRYRRFYGGTIFGCPSSSLVGSS